MRRGTSRAACARRSMRSEPRILGSIVLAAFLVAGCAQLPPLDMGTPVQLRVWTTPTTVEVDAPTWVTDASRIYLCATEPPRVPDGATDGGWAPGGACQDVGTYPGPDGLRVSLPIGALDADQRPAFDDASDWYLLILELDGRRITNSVRTAFHAPPGGVP